MRRRDPTRTRYRTAGIHKRAGELVDVITERNGWSADELAATAKTQWAANKKELTAVVTTQRRRLYDAMCVRREWTGAERRERLLEHPIMGVLVAGLVWHLDNATARPDLAGVLRTLDGIAVESAPDAPGECCTSDNTCT